MSANENKEVQIQSIVDKFKKINLRLFEESKSRYPSPSSLNRAASQIMQTLKDIKTDDSEFNDWKYWRIRELDIFIADLPGELNQDYKNKLVRYRGKWSKEKDKIDNWIYDFKQKFRK